MKAALNVILAIFILASATTFAADGFVIIYGNKIEPRNDQNLEVICLDNKEYVVGKKEIDGVITQEIDTDIYPWFKLAHEGRCTGLETLAAGRVSLDKNSPLNLEYLVAGTEEYYEQLAKHTSYDSNLKDFYQQVNSDAFSPTFDAVTRKWPIGDDVYLVEQCFSVSAKVAGFPSNNRDFVFGQKYKRTIINDDDETVLIDSDFNLTQIYCDCDGNPPPTCQSITKLSDINGNKRYEIRYREDQPEGMILRLQEFDGEALSTVFEMCTGDFSHPLNSINCPDR